MMPRSEGVSSYALVGVVITIMCIGCAAITGRGAQRTEASVNSEEQQIRLALEQWKQAPEQDTRGMAPRTSFNFARAAVQVTGSAAVVEPVYALTGWGLGVFSFSLRKKDDQWVFKSWRHVGEGVIETALPDLDPGYLPLLNRWMEANLGWVQKTLRENPPNGGDQILRRHALCMLDEPLHIRSAPALEPVKQFIRSNVDLAISQIRTERVAAGATIWKFYNHGWVVRTANHTWAHDIYEGPEGLITGDQIDAILDKVEVLFLSHWHGDHSSPRVMKRARDKGIPVLVTPWPAEGGYADYIRSEMTDANGSLDWLTVVQPGSSGEIRGLQYHAFPGHQDQLLNNAYAVTVDGMTILQMGDQWNLDDFVWIDSVKTRQRTDILLPNVWTAQMKRVLAGVAPRVVVPGHENEIGHSFEHREPYDQAYEVLAPAECQWHVMAWGERLHVEPAPQQ